MLLLISQIIIGTIWGVSSFILVLAAGFCLALIIVGPKGTAELILNGIPEMDDSDAYVDPITKASGTPRDD